ncbi:YopX family protein [Epilithonimonas hominis]|uniref:YopX family protein n=1 Tax=Epilithonimonas hominis TaxID=420404 RepID=UPI0028991EDE|nr:YopX family protein [Epilithonimonas hominis]
MEEFKLRIWNPHGKNMIYDIDNVFECLKQQFSFDKTMPDRGFVIPYDHKSEGMVWMRYFGKKDKNQVDIYQGDILELVNSEGQKIRVVCQFGTVERELKGTSVNLCEITGFYFRFNEFATFPIVNNYAGCNDVDLFEVIGNIYENPELIDF